VSIEIANESGVEVDETSLASLARHVLDGMRVHPLAELSVLLVDEPAMTELHMRWMGEPGPTDVLAFPMDEIRPPQPGGTHADHSTAEPPDRSIRTSTSLGTKVTGSIPRTSSAGNTETRIRNANCEGQSDAV